MVIGNPVVKEKKCKEWKWFDPSDTPKNSFFPCVENNIQYRSRIESTSF